MEVGDLVIVTEPCCQEKMKYLGWTGRIIDKQDGPFCYKLQEEFGDGFVWWWSYNEIRPYSELFE